MWSSSYDQHGVAVDEEAVAFADGLGIGGENHFATACFARCSERADEHKQSGAGEVKIREEGINDFETARRVDKDLRPATSCAEFSCRCIGGAFQHAYGSGADGNDPAAFPLGGIDGVSG